MNPRIVVASAMIVAGLAASLALVLPMIGLVPVGIGLNRIVIAGTLEAGVEAGCVLLRADNGTRYLLSGWKNYPPYGTRVTVTGSRETNVASYCMQGSAMIHVTSIVPADRDFVGGVS